MVKRDTGACYGGKIEIRNSKFDEMPLIFKRRKARLRQIEHLGGLIFPAVPRATF
jgi:hypothetical protein